MPPFRRRRRTFRKRPYGRPKKSGGTFATLSRAWKTAKWAARTAWKLKGLVNSEMFKHDYQEAGTVITTSGAYSVQLSAIAQGDGSGARTGDSVFLRSVHIRGQTIYNATAGTTPTFLRLMVVQDSQQIGDTVPTIGQVIDIAAGGFNAHMLESTAGRFKILKNMLLVNDSVQNTVRNFEINLPMRHHVRFNGTLDTDIQRGGIYIMAVSSEATNGPKLIYNSRTSYHDN